MDALVLALVLLATVLASSVFDQLIPRIPLPLIQIACGVLVSVLARGQIQITLNPDLFLVLFIAPLLFNEAREANNLSLWKNRRIMLSFAIGLVVAIVLAVGFLVNWLVPSIPLAAAFALGAALGPTDPLAVQSVSKQADIPARQKVTLQGESLFNDASGIVSFQFAVAAIVTGSFSVLEALKSFAIEFFGALIVGIILGYALVKAADKVRDWGLDNTTFHVLLELLSPFIAYLLGAAIGVSGVILVVACGITTTLVPRSFAPSISRMNIVSTSVWKVFAFALNGVVFVLLGTQLPQAFFGMWDDIGMSNVDLFLYIMAITVAMYAIRLLWTLMTEAVSLRRARKTVTLPERLRSASIMTFSGAKGAITLAIMFSLPFTIVTDGTTQAFPQRDLLIFLASGVILLSLLIATFAVPLLAPREDDQSKTREKDIEGKAEVLRAVIEELAERQNDENSEAMSQIITQYAERLERFKEEEDLDDDSFDELRIMVLGWEQEYVLDLVERDEVPPLEGYQYVSRAARIASMIEREKRKTLALARWMRRTRTFGRKMWKRLWNRLPGDSEAPMSESASIMRDIQVRASERVITLLEEEMAHSEFQSEKIGTLIAEYQHTVSLLKGPAPSITAITRNSEIDLETTRLALRIELEKIQAAFEEGLISRRAMRKMRENVYLMQIDLDDQV